MSLSRDFDDEASFQPTRQREIKRRERIDLRLKVLVFDIKTGEQIREHNTDWTSESRQWLHALIMWAAKNKKSVEVYNIQDDDLNHGR